MHLAAVRVLGRGPGLALAILALAALVAVAAGLGGALVDALTWADPSPDRLMGPFRWEPASAGFG